jgi:hypothetical protein
MADDVKKDGEEKPAPKTSADLYADFIGKQIKSGIGSPFDTRGVLPTSRKDVSDSIGRTSKNDK